MKKGTMSFFVYFKLVYFSFAIKKVSCKCLIFILLQLEKECYLKKCILQL